MPASHQSHRFVLARAMAPAGLAIVVALVVSGAASAPVTVRHVAHHMNMSDAAMQQAAATWWATHARVGQPSLGLPAATVNVANFYFDADGNVNNGPDTVKISVGESVLWSWSSGSHTVTSGAGSGDPNAGTMFDQPSNSSNTEFSFQFMNAGLFPYFCRIHEFDMTGFVKVSAPTNVPGPGSRDALGFSAAPSPNPTRSGVNFQIALREAGRARVDVIDASGRLVAKVFDRELGAGSHALAWNGRSSAGRNAAPGIYYLRLQLPGLTDSRRIVVTR